MKVFFLYWILESDDLNISTISPPGKYYFGLIRAEVSVQSVTGVSGLQSNRLPPQTWTCHELLPKDIVYILTGYFLEILNSSYLSVYSRGPAYDVQIDKLGVYKRTNETKNGKSTWRINQTGHSIFFNGKKINY